MKRTWTLHRHHQGVPDADRRWDRAYQQLLAWSQLTPPAPPGGPSYSNSNSIPRQEVEDAHRSLCPGLDRPPDPGPDH